MKVQYGDACLSLEQVYEWTRKFMNGTSSVNRLSSTWSGAPGKVMLNLYEDERGVILEHYMPRGNTVNSATYPELLKNHLRPPIKSKRRGLLSSSILLQHDNVRPHTARSTVATIQDLSFECLPHSS